MTETPENNSSNLSTDRYEAVLAEVSAMLEAARHEAARTINTLMTATYWELGRRIVELEQQGAERAEYGKQIVEQLAKDLSPRFGRGFKKSNLFQMRSFYLAYPDAAQPLSEDTSNIFQTVSGKFPLPWSHYVKLLSVKDSQARAFYEAEALRGGWSVRQLGRQISTQFYERALLSRNKAAMLEKATQPDTRDATLAVSAEQRAPEDELKDPFVLEFLSLKDEYSENDLEEALIQHIESFLLELGNDFAFLGRQKRLRIGDQWFRVDLLFFHRRLRCLVIVELKLGEFSYADAGQMHLYLNYAREHWMYADENPPVGLILCNRKDEAIAHYALEGLPNKVMAAEYQMVLPNEKLLAAELERTRKALEQRKLTDNDPNQNE